MPELPEVERARKLIAETCTGYTIDEAETVEDAIVYAGTDHREFAREVQGRTITGCERKGKQFWITLSGEGRLPVMHFGMTGMIQLRGQEPTWYRRKIHLGETTDSWPPRFHKLILKLRAPEGSPARELAFIDPRRLGRLRLVPDPVLSHPPLSELGFDPVLSHPTFDEFVELIARKKGSVKGLIMDQAFSAGVGNWVADEVLYQARIHPLHPVPALEDAQLRDLHRLLREIPLQAISVNADASQFPDHWLFRWRWDKGKKKGGKKGAKKGDEEKMPEDGGDEKPKFLALPDGTPATITFVTVAGRTSAVVAQLQKLPSGAKVKLAPTAKGRKRKNKDEDEDEDEDEEEAEEEEEEEEQEEEEEEAPKPKRARAGAKPNKATRVNVTKVKVTTVIKQETSSTNSRASRAAARAAAKLVT